MGKGIREIDVACPFYKHDDGRSRVTCEGVIDDSSVALIFYKKRDYEKQMEVFCCKHYPKCELYRMLVENKYQE